MTESSHPLLIVSCKVLELAETSPLAPRIFRLLGRKTREGAHLLLTASEPDQWFPTRSNKDSVLSRQSRLLERLQEAGGELDGVYYVPRSMFTQDRKRATALRDILRRYGAKPSDATLVSTSGAFLRAARRLEMRTLGVVASDAGMEELLAALENGEPVATTGEPPGGKARQASKPGKARKSGRRRKAED